jgi:ribosome-binding protein aMBF1 (putative translation factor)
MSSKVYDVRCGADASRHTFDVKDGWKMSVTLCDVCGSQDKVGIIVKEDAYFTLCDSCLSNYSDSQVAAKIARRKDEEIAKLRESLKIVRRNLAEALTKVWMKELEDKG